MLGPEIHSLTNDSKIADVTVLRESQIRVILLDIEGTTTPIDFVYQTLFPYADSKMEAFLREHVGDQEIGALMRDLREQYRSDERDGFQPPAWVDDSEETRLSSASAYGQWLIARDSKCTPLKSLQGKIWQEGFATGELKGRVYPDVPIAFGRWRQQHKLICIYSSGSVLAQQLLFRTTLSGDLTPYISAFFDTSVGAKTDAESYKKIAASLDCAPEEFLFISDAVKEIGAAESAGMQAMLCDRDGRASTSPIAREIINSLDEVF